MSEEIRNEIKEMIEKVAEDLCPFVDESCEITIPVLARRLGISGPTAKKKLEALEKNGELERVQRRAKSGNKVAAWRKRE